MNALFTYDQTAKNILPSVGSNWGKSVSLQSLNIEPDMGVEHNANGFNGIVRWQIDSFPVSTAPLLTAVILMSF